MLLLFYNQTKEVGMSKEPKVVTEGPVRHYHPIRPKDFSLDSFGALASTFGKSEVEKTARNIICFCQRRGGWYPFTVEELIDFYKEVGEDPRFIFFGLLGAWEDEGMFAQHTNPWREPPSYLVIGADGMYRVTEQFIQQCASGKPIAPAAK